MIRESYRMNTKSTILSFTFTYQKKERNTKSNPAPNFQWTYSHFIGNDLPSQIHYTLLWSPRQKTCGRSAYTNSSFVVFPSYTLHVLR